jgi:hypothetical protein
MLPLLPPLTDAGSSVIAITSASASTASEQLGAVKRRTDRFPLGCVTTSSAATTPSAPCFSEAAKAGLTAASVTSRMRFDLRATPAASSCQLAQPALASSDSRAVDALSSAPALLA